MRREAVVEQVRLHPLGEIRMGCEAYGIEIETNFGVFELFKAEPILIGHSDYQRCLHQSKCKGYLLLKAAFATYMLHIKSQTISVYRATIRCQSQEWSEEQAIYGGERTHVSGFSQHYYLQFPFVKQARFQEVFDQYVALRQSQIAQAANAI